MKLYVFPLAPNGAKLRIYLAEKRHAGASIELTEVVVNLIEGEHKKPEFLARSPFGTIPVLELDDGRILHESLAIIEYFEEIHPEPSMWGHDPYERCYARQIERMADQRGLVAIARYVHASKSPLGLPPNPVIAENQRDVWVRGLDYFEELMSDGRPFLAGENVTVADCTLQGGLQFGRFRDVPTLDGRPKLTEWMDRFRARPTAEGNIFF